MDRVKETSTNISKIHVVFFFSFIIVLTPASSLDGLKCNLMNGSIFTFNCPDARIWVNSMDYYAVENDICSRRLGCNKTLSGEEDGENILCHGQYGKCTQLLDNTILYGICPNVTGLAVEINYDCTPIDADVPMEKVECPLSNDILRPHLDCPDNSVIHVHSVGYWKVSENRTCLESKDQCYKCKTGVEDLLYKKCRGENECMPTLPESINDGLGCDYQIPNIGADIKYSCLNNESMYDVCDSLELEVPNNTSMYLISREYINKPGVYEEQFCRCKATSKGMDVKLLYYDMPPDTVGKRSQLILSDTVQRLNLKLAEIVDAEPFLEPKTNLTVEYIHKNISNLLFLIEFKVSASTDNSNEGGLVQDTGTSQLRGTIIFIPDEDILIIGIVLGLLVLIAFIILVIALIIRRRRQYKTDEEESVYSGLDNPAFLHQTYTILEGDTKSESSDFISDPQNQTSIPIHHDGQERLGDIREIVQSEHIENNGLNRIGPNDMGSIPESIPEVNEPLDNYDPNYMQIDNFRESEPSTSASYLLVAPPVENVEYAKVNKIKKEKVQNGSLFDNSFSNINPPQIPDKTYTEEEISNYRQEKLKPYINISNTPKIEDQKADQHNTNYEGEDEFPSIPVNSDVVILQSISDSPKHDDDESVLSGNDLSTVPEEDENLDMTSSFPDVSSAIESPPRQFPRQSSYTAVPFLY
ncbi:hypothetical protein LOTGIDRAFT_161776 [Lottia gigantea]|uniref:Uncharacterized protein n=1 Tax=Lottia gigantea TaxID=225164 RepID=V4ADM3_LOTGI|nr:hypothetical protein LOTGIDRAFT_161776 [Lottia gigantea]ESO93225.1 hypothetical protein LOTGIDRAFT_161776 [Lottia gigantea]